MAVEDSESGFHNEATVALVSKSGNEELSSILHFPLKTQLVALLEDLDLSIVPVAHRTGTGLPAVLFDYALAESSAHSSADVLQALSTAAAQPGLIQPIYSRCKLLFPDILARWLETAPTSEEEWERKLFALSEIAGYATELW